MVVTFLGVGAAVGSSLVHGAAPGIVITGAVFLVLGYAFYCTAFAAAWQAAVSAVLLAVGTVWMARTAATIYERSVLRTGSRVRLRQVLGRAPVS